MTNRDGIAVVGAGLLVLTVVSLSALRMQPKRAEVVAPHAEAVEPLTHHEERVGAEMFRTSMRKVSLKGVPSSDPKIDLAIRTPQDWKNPFLVVGPGHITVVGRGDVKIEDLEDFLIDLSTSAWPYGRVAAVQELGITSGNDDFLIKDNLAQVLKILKRLDVRANMWPSA